jgi:hypothetical protein
VTKEEGLTISLATPESIQKLQTALHDKAKKSPDFRFYSLYDKVYRKDVLTYAYACGKANGGVAGVDNQTFEDIEAWSRAMVGRIDAGAERSNLSTTCCATGLHSEARKQ